jgi:hypothetical protein
VADHLIPNQVLGFLNSSGKVERGKFTVSKACKAFIGADSKEIEDAPLAAVQFLISKN